MPSGTYGHNTLGCSESEWRVRVDLSAAYHLASQAGYNEASTNAFTAAVPGESDRYLVFRFETEWDEVTASSLLKVDKDGKVIKGKGKCETAGCIINRYLHEGRSEPTGAVLHTHQTPVSALATLASNQFPRLHVANSYFQDEIIIDDECNGQYDAEAEGKRLSGKHCMKRLLYHIAMPCFKAPESAMGLIGGSRVLVQRDHGPYVAAESVAVAWWYLHHLQKIANVAIAALSTGKQLHSPSSQETQKREQNRIQELAELNFEASKRLLLKGPHADFIC